MAEVSILGQEDPVRCPYGKVFVVANCGSYALTYTNAFGESAESDWSPLYKVLTKCSKVKVSETMFNAGNPSASLGTNVH